MDDLISRSAALAVGNVRKVVEYDEAGYDVEYQAVPVDVIEKIPVIDAVPVVRCRDCRYAFGNHGHDKNGCPIQDRRIWMGGDGFCSEGKRMDGEKNADHQRK